MNRHSGCLQLLRQGQVRASIVGSAVSGFFAEEIGAMNLILICAGLLLLTLPIISRLKILKEVDLGEQRPEGRP